MLSLSRSTSSQSARRLDRARAALGERAAVSRTSAPGGSHRSLEVGLHEWFSADHLPPIALLVDLAWQTLKARPGGRVCWVGRVCWPYPPALLRRGGDRSDTSLLDASVFIDARSAAERVWAIEVASRCEGVGMVIADGRGIGMAESRRLQLAAAAAGTAAQLIRPDEERAELSAARTRWRAEPQRSTGRSQAWSVELLRSKGGTDAWLGSGRARQWAAQRDHATGTISEWQTSDGDLASEVVRRPASQARTQIA